MAALGWLINLGFSGSSAEVASDTVLHPNALPGVPYQFGAKVTPSTTVRAIAAGPAFGFQAAQGLNKTIGLLQEEGPAFGFVDGTATVAPATVFESTFLSYTAIGMREHLDPGQERVRAHPDPDVPDTDEEVTK